MATKLILSAICLLPLLVVHVEGQRNRPRFRPNLDRTLLRTAKPIGQAVGDIQKNLDAQQAAIGQALGLDPNIQFSSLFPNIANFNAAQISKCYNSTLGNENFNMFDNPIFGLIQAYYVSFLDSEALSS